MSQLPPLPPAGQRFLCSTMATSRNSKTNTIDCFITGRYAPAACNIERAKNLIRNTYRLNELLLVWVPFSGRTPPKPASPELVSNNGKGKCKSYDILQHPRNQYPFSRGDFGGNFQEEKIGFTVLCKFGFQYSVCIVEASLFRKHYRQNNTVV